MNALRTLVLVLGLVLLGLGGVRADEGQPAPAIEIGSTVLIEYTLSDDDGKVLDSNKGRNPLTSVQGEQQIVPGLEKALNGMHAGEEKKVTVEPAEGYGDVDPRALAEVPKRMIPPDALNVGTELLARNPEGATRLVRIKEIKDETVIIDLNHPLAGKTLHFEVKVGSVGPPVPGRRARTRADAEKPAEAEKPAARAEKPAETK